MPPSPTARPPPPTPFSQSARRTHQPECRCQPCLRCLPPPPRSIPPPHQLPELSLHRSLHRSLHCSLHFRLYRRQCPQHAFRFPPLHLSAQQQLHHALPENGEPLTVDKLDRLNKETERREKVPAGYKNIPSLDAITAQAETIEDPKTPGLRIKAPEHPLEHSWTIFHDTKNKVPFTLSSAPGEPPNSAHFMAPESEEYEAGLTVIGECDTVESFCRYFNWLKPPSKLERNSNYHLFKSGIKPMWEDEANANGGKWVLTMKNNPQLLDRCWSWLAMALVGEDLDEGDEICGAVVSLRSKVDRIQLWTRSKEDVEKINGIGRKMAKLLDISEADGIGLEFQYNNDDKQVPNKFLTIQTVPSSSYRTSFHGNPPGSARSRDQEKVPQRLAQVLQLHSPVSALEARGCWAPDGEASVRERVTDIS
ncbi:Eukaryotic translation initiation factor 4E type 2 [Grifola frondosa]|uniref:Eukaryotic translation initiation factor 4E type 2 n=1 Tax=Grifola frondosa TaxID=5627 RepID=A0A1C7MNE1_GRIFR|nr:Eukaryotic translation initiation factor 4E type 2 [Grifola frondosa]